MHFTQVTFTQVSFVNTLACFIGLAFVLAQRRQANDRLLGLILVLGIMLTTLIEKVTAGDADTQTLVLFDLLASAVSTWVLARAALGLMNKKGVVLQIGLIVSFLVQGYTFLAHADGHTLIAYQALDVSTCLIAGTLYAIGLSQNFSYNKYLSFVAFVGPTAWAGGCVTYWLDTNQYFMITEIGKCAMIGGVALTSLMSGLLALRQPPDETPTPALPA